MLETLETPIHPAEKKLVLEAISDSAGKITVADIATKTALPVLKAAALLNQIAYETGGHLTVGTAGNVVYEFDRNFENSYLTKGSKNFFRRAWRVIFNAAAYLVRIFALVMFFLVRVSFGIVLVLSVVLVIALIVIAILAILSKLSGDDSGDSGFNFDLGGSLGGLGRILRYCAIDWLWDWWYWGDYLRWDPTPDYRPVPAERPQEAGEAGKRKDKENFLDKCFSFLFGDGDPNQGLEERYWQTLARVLKAKNGVVVAEQLAPYATVKGRNEDWVLPILVRFNGTCDVSEGGNIIYSFPSFQQKILEGTGEHNKAVDSSAMPSQAEELHTLFKKHIEQQKASHAIQAAQSHLETHLREKLWELSHVTGGARTTIICFAVFVLVGSLWLMTMTLAIPIFLLFFPLLLAMAAYGAMFLIIPGIRALVIKHLNARIEERNSLRFNAANRLANPDPDLRKKMEEAEQARRLALQQSCQEEVAYTTDKDLLEQRFENKNLDGEPQASAADAAVGQEVREQPVDLPLADESSESISIKKESLEELRREDS